IKKQELLNDRFRMEQDGIIEMYYAPHNEYVNPYAKIVIVGITPGWTQMKAAFLQAKQCLQQNVPLSELIQRTKKAACFSGTMRHNLIDMLDACGVQTACQLHSSRFLFSDAHHLLHTTSIIKYPVFVYGKNYTGYTPKIAQS